jgi:hypothetical protein
MEAHDCKANIRIPACFISRRRLCSCFMNGKAEYFICVESSCVLF